MQCENQYKLKIMRGQNCKIKKTPLRMFADSVTIMNTLGSGACGSMPGSSKNIISFPKGVNSSGAYLASCPIDTGGSFPERTETG